jgi:hypothetical protein
MAQLPGQGVFIGTSSRKYPGWCEMLSDNRQIDGAPKILAEKYVRHA